MARRLVLQGQVGPEHLVETLLKLLHILGGQVHPIEIGLPLLGSLGNDLHHLRRPLSLDLCPGYRVFPQANHGDEQWYCEAIHTFSSLLCESFYVSLDSGAGSTRSQESISSSILRSCSPRSKASFSSPLSGAPSRKESPLRLF